LLLKGLGSSDIFIYAQTTFSLMKRGFLGKKGIGIETVVVLFLAIALGALFLWALFQVFKRIS